MTDFNTDEWLASYDTPSQQDPLTHDTCLLRYVKHHTYLFQGKFPKLVIQFDIVSGKHEGEAAEVHYNVIKIWGKRRFKVGKRCKFTKDFYRLFTSEPKHRADEFPIQPFRHATIEAQVSKVTHDREDALPAQLQWLLVDKMLRVKP